MSEPNTTLSKLSSAAEDDWVNIADKTARKRAQNRIAQRNYSEPLRTPVTYHVTLRTVAKFQFPGRNMKQRLEQLERRNVSGCVNQRNESHHCCSAIQGPKDNERSTDSFMNLQLHQINTGPCHHTHEFCVPSLAQPKSTRTAPVPVSGHTDGQLSGQDLSQSLDSSEATHDQSYGADTTASIKSPFFFSENSGYVPWDQAEGLVPDKHWSKQCFNQPLQFDADGICCRGKFLVQPNLN